MTIEQVLSQCDTQCPNGFTRAQKIQWLSKLDRTIKKEILDTHTGAVKDFDGYDPNTPADTCLLVGEPYDTLYGAYLMAQIDLHNAEYARYNNSAALFNAAYTEFANAYNREHLPKEATKIKY